MVLVVCIWNMRCLEALIELWWSPSDRRRSPWMYLVCRCDSKTCNVCVTTPSQCEYLFSSFGSFTRWSYSAQAYKVERFHKWVQIRDHTVQILTTHAQCSVYKNIWFVAGVFLPHFVYASKHTLLHNNFTCRDCLIVCRNFTKYWDSDDNKFDPPSFEVLPTQNRVSGVNCLNICRIFTKHRELFGYCQISQSSPQRNWCPGPDATVTSPNSMLIGKWLFYLTFHGWTVVAV